VDHQINDVTTDDEEDHEGVKIGGMVNSSPTDVKVTN
jgi:hypothetical protein